MNKKLTASMGLLAALVLGLSACDNASFSDDAMAQAARDVVRPGLGEAPGLPETTPFVLPAGVRLVGEIRGADEASGECEDPGAPPGGSGIYVRICVPLENLTGSPVQIEFPAGLVVVSTAEGRNQHGLLIEKTLLTVPPTVRGGGGCRRSEEDRKRPAREEAEEPCAYVAPLYLYCLNEERDPSNPFITYAFSGVTRDSALLELLRMLDGKTVDGVEDVAAVQRAIYSITDGDGLTREDRAALARL